CSFFNSPRAVPIPATPAASTAAEAAFLATRLSFDPALEKEGAFDLDDALAFVGFFTFGLTAARFGNDLDLLRFAVFFGAIQRSTRPALRFSRDSTPFFPGRSCDGVR